MDAMAAKTAVSFIPFQTKHSPIDDVYPDAWWCLASFYQKIQNQLPPTRRILLHLYYE